MQICDFTVAPAIAKLRRFNLIAGVLPAAQAAAVLALSNDFSLPVTAAYMAGPPGTTYTEPVTLFDSPIGLGVALFLALSAVAHFFVISGRFWERYATGLTRHHNYFRWVEYAISSSVMIVVIASLTGIQDIGALIAIFGAKRFRTLRSIEQAVALDARRA